MPDTPLLDQYWQDASARLNAYVGEEGGGNIDWERAKAVFRKLAMSGQGNFGDWVNGAMAQKASWLNVPAAATTPAGDATPAPTGPKVYGGDLYGSLDKWNDPNHKTPKYVIGRIVEKYYNGSNNAGEAMAKALAEVQALFPGTTFDGKHRYNIPGVSSSVDMKSGKGRLQWYDDDAVKARATTPPPTTATTTTTPARVAVGLSTPAAAQLTVADRWGGAQPTPRLTQGISLPQTAPRPGMTLQSVMPNAAAPPPPMPMPNLTPLAPPTRHQARAPMTLADLFLRGR